MDKKHIMNANLMSIQQLPSMINAGIAFKIEGHMKSNLCSKRS